MKGRRDDVLILSAGSVVVAALDVENAVRIEREELIRAAMLVGHGREETGLLVELKEGVDRQEGAEKVLDVVRRVNLGLWEKARASGDMIMVLEEGKRLPVGVKGNVKRREAGKIVSDGD